VKCAITAITYVGMYKFDIRHNFVRRCAFTDTVRVRSLDVRDVAAEWTVQAANNSEFSDETTTSMRLKPCFIARSDSTQLASWVESDRVLRTGLVLQEFSRPQRVVLFVSFRALHYLDEFCQQPIKSSQIY